MIWVGIRPRLHVIFVALAIFCSSGLVEAQQEKFFQFTVSEDSSEVHSYSVMCLSQADCVDQLDISSHNSLLRQAMAEKYEVLEREMLDDVLAEQKLALSGLTREVHSVLPGNLEGASGIVYSSLSCHDELISVNSRLIDIESGKVIWEATAILTDLLDYFERLKSAISSGNPEMSSIKNDEEPAGHWLDCHSLDYNGYTYDLVMYEGRCWFNENLRYIESIPLINSDSDWRNAESGHSAHIRHQGENVAVYNWFSVSHYALCPSGWRVPSKSDIPGFSALGESPVKLQNGKVVTPNAVFFWTSTISENSSSRAYCFKVDGDKVLIETQNKLSGLGIRCIRD